MEKIYIKNLYGELYVPENKEHYGIVIFCHELGHNRSNVYPYIDTILSCGYAVFTFDFYGGSILSQENKSGGTSTEMSILTEMQDIETILKEIETWSCIEKDKIILMGASQGGTVASLYASRNKDKISKLLLLYPPLALSNWVKENYPTKDTIPEEIPMWDGWIVVSSKYVLDIYDIDIYKEIENYTNPVLLLHGTKDTTVDISSSDEASQHFPMITYKKIKDGRHGFEENCLKEACLHIKTFL